MRVNPLPRQADRGRLADADDTRRRPRPDHEALALQFCEGREGADMTSVVSDTGPFSIIPEWLLDVGVGDRAIRLYAVLGRYADKVTGFAFPSRKTLSARLKCSIRSVDRAIEELQEVGALRVEHRRADDGDWQSNLYIVSRVAHSTTPVAGGGDTAGTRGSDTGVPTGGDTGGDLTRATLNESSVSVPETGGPPPLMAARKAFVGAPENERVARLIDLGDCIGLRRNGGFAARIVKKFGQGQGVVDAVVAAGEYAEGDQWKYVWKVLNDGPKTGRRTERRNAGAAASAQDIREQWG